MNPAPEIRWERLFGDRVVRCFADRETNIYGWFEKLAAADPTRDALIDSNSRFTFAELLSEIGRVAYGLSERGLKAGDRVLLYAGNRVEFVIACYAVLKIGGTVIPVDIRLQTEEVRYIAQDCDASAIIHDASLAVPAIGELPPGCQVIAIPASGSGERLMASVPDGSSRDFVDVGEEALALIVYTSGTTGRPKGAMLAHVNVIHSCLHFHLNEGIEKTDRIGVVTPITHVTGLIMGLMGALQAGATAIILETFKKRLFLEMAARERMTQTVMVPAMYSLCLLDEAFDTFDLSAWRLGNYGGAPMPEPVILTMAKKLPQLQLINGYGASETASPAAMLRPGEGVAYASAVGRPVACAEILIMDENGREVPEGVAGEIWIGGPMVAKGYWNNPTATAAAFTGGYWHSGDIGSIDEKGYVRVLDRIKDVVNRGGYKIYSAEVESVLAQFDGVVESAVIGRPDPVLGERVHAFVSVTRDDITSEQLQAHCAALLADYKVPEFLTISTERLPRSSNGKVLKRDLRETVKAVA